MSLTSSERRALAWLLALAATGAGVRIVRSWRDAGAATLESCSALRLQLVAVDSAQRAERQRQRPTGRTARERRRQPRVTGATNLPIDPAVTGGVPASPPAAASPLVVRPRRPSAQVPTLGTVDVDRADAAELERLPRIGPALAARIVADREQHGPFGSLAGLQRVRGIGPKLAAGLASTVTFSGIRRPSAVPH